MNFEPVRSVLTDAVGGNVMTPEVSEKVGNRANELMRGGTEALDAYFAAARETIGSNIISINVESQIRAVVSKVDDKVVVKKLVQPAPADKSSLLNDSRPPALDKDAPVAQTGGPNVSSNLVQNPPVPPVPPM